MYGNRIVGFVSAGLLERNEHRAGGGQSYNYFRLKLLRADNLNVCSLVMLLSFEFTLYIYMVRSGEYMQHKANCQCCCNFAARAIHRLIMQLNTNSLLYYRRNRMRGHNWITVRECNCLAMESRVFVSHTGCCCICGIVTIVMATINGSVKSFCLCYCCCCFLLRYYSFSNTNTTKSVESVELC